MENSEFDQTNLQPARFFWRRVFAYFIDMLIVAALFSVLALSLNAVFDTKFMAPSLAKSKTCEPENTVSREQLGNIFPDEPGLRRSQFVCRYTTMGITSMDLVVLIRETNKDGVNYRQKISLPLDRNVSLIESFILDSMMYLVGPLFFALLLSRSGKTIGKRWMGLRVQGSNGSVPVLRRTIFREYVKSAPLWLFAISSAYEGYQLTGLGFEAAAQTLGPLTEMLVLNEINAILLVGFGLSIVVFWFMFGSFIRWRGQAYWDRWTGLQVIKGK